MAAVLVVSDNPAAAAISGRLEAAAVDVVQCPGPQAPDYTCIGSRGGRCPLAAAVDLVVLDCDLPCDAARTGATSLELGGYYTGLGIPVIALVNERDQPAARLAVPHACVLDHDARPSAVAATVLRTLVGCGP